MVITWRSNVTSRPQAGWGYHWQGAVEDLPTGCSRGADEACHCSHQRNEASYSQLFQHYMDRIRTWWYIVFGCCFNECRAATYLLVTQIECGCPELRI